MNLGEREGWADVSLMAARFHFSKERAFRKQRYRKELKARITYKKKTRKSIKPSLIKTYRG